MSADFLRDFSTGGLGYGLASAVGAGTVVAGVLATQLVLGPLYGVLLSRHPDQPGSHIRRRRFRNRAWFASLCAGIFALLHAATPPDHRTEFLPYAISLLVLLTLAGALALDLLISFFTEFVPVRSGRPPMSQFFKDVLRTLGLLAVTAIAVKQAFPATDLGQLLATSAVLSLVVGLALQESLSNIFSGLMLTIDEPYKPGDWVEIDGREGKILDSNWRTIRILTRDDDVLYVPNRTMAGTTILNLSSPTPLHRVRRKMGVEYGAPPNKVCQVLTSAIKQADGVLETPAPEVFVLDYADFAIIYEMRFWINDHPNRTRTESDVMRAVWYQLKRNGIAIPFPVRDVYLRKDKPAKMPDEIVALLRKVDFLAPLQDEERRLLAEDLGSQMFAAGEIICRQGDAGSTFYIIKSGTVSVSVVGDQGGGVTGVQAEVARLSEGAYFGEMSLLTGTPRSSTVRAVVDCELMVLDRESFSVLIGNNPTIAQHMSEILAARQSASQQRLASESATRSFARGPAGSGKQDILDKIRAIFRFR